MTDEKMYPSLNPDDGADTQLKTVDGPPPSAQQQQQPVPATIVMPPPPVRFGPLAVELDCPHCNERVMTRVDTSAGLLTWLIAVVMFLFGTLLCCIPVLFSWLPFCISGCKDVNHYCPKCNRVVGTCKRIG